jgi:hypothetical protein
MNLNHFNSIKKLVQLSQKDLMLIKILIILF